MMHSPSRTLPLLILLGLVLLDTPLGALADEAQATATHDFGRVLQGTPVKHSFRVENPREEPFRLARVDKSKGIQVEGAFAEISPGATAALTVSLDTRTLEGSYQGVVMLYGEGAQTPHSTWVLTGEILPPVSVKPRPVVFLAANRGEEQSKSIVLQNNEKSPLIITEVQRPADRFTTKIETLDEGRRYRLHIAINPNGPGGKHTDSINIKTTSLTLPDIRVSVNTYLRERVYTFPESVEMGTLRFTDIEHKPEILPRFSQTLMVYSRGARDFQIKARSDLPLLEITAEPGPLRDRYQITIAFRKEEIHPGPIAGSIQIETNDPEFPRLAIPVNGQISRGPLPHPR